MRVSGTRGRHSTPTPRAGRVLRPHAAQNDVRANPALVPEALGLTLDWQLALLSNGLRLITIARPGTPTVAVRAYVRAGSRYDVLSEGTGLSLPESCQDSVEDKPLGPRPLGLAHLTEHLLFKGTRRHSQRELFARVEGLGGTLDGGTSKEYITLSSVAPRQGLTAGVDVLTEVLTQPAFREEDFWQEKLVAVEEIRRTQDGQSILFDLFAETLWLQHPLRCPIQGTLEGLRDLSYEPLLAFYRRRFVTGNMLLVVCGDIGHEETRRLAAERSAAIPSGPEQPPGLPCEPPMTEPRRAHLNKDLHQIHMLIGVPTVPMAHADRSALKVIERVLGMGGSARLYQRLREEARLVYSVNTVTAHYEDAGYFAVHTACDPGHAGHVEELVLEEWDKLRHCGVSEEELSAAKSNYAGTLARRFETNLAVAGIFGVEALLHRIEGLDAAVQRIHAVSRDEVLRVARKYLDTERYVAVSIGRTVEA